MNCFTCNYWFGDNRPLFTYTGCELGLENLELSYFYLEDKLIIKETGKHKICKFYKG